MKHGAAFLAAIALGAIMAGAPPTAAAQQPEKVFRIGILSPAERSSTRYSTHFAKACAISAISTARTSGSSTASLPGIPAECRRWLANWCGCRSTLSSPTPNNPQ
jgi:hypothetical protein